jgi:hypothetical protein
MERKTEANKKYESRIDFINKKIKPRTIRGFFMR